MKRSYCCVAYFQMQQILYQNYKEDKGSFKSTLKSKEVEKAVTLHPVKDPDYQYRIFNYLQSVNIMKYRQRRVRTLKCVGIFIKNFKLQ